MHYNPQQTKIIELCKDGYSHCQKEFQVISWCAHKRRAEIEKKGEYVFSKKKCDHGISGSNDWWMTRAEKVEPRVQSFLYKVNQPVTNFRDPN